MFITSSDHVKIGDLGFSKSVESKSSITPSFPGTINYRSPEIIRQDPKYAKNKKIDIW
jgi:serine/threonine protein kinase